MKLLAVSGGIDSMCMAEMSARNGGDFAVAHCNFTLRGSDSDADESFVRQWCSERGIRFHSIRFDTSLFAQSRGISIEMAARVLRYDWFAQLCNEFGYTSVCVAHNANDNAETLILNLLRGTGSRGMRGMAARHSYTATDGSKVIVERPLLEKSRQEICEWMLSNGCNWREDDSNASGEYKRNRIRNEVFPIFEEINPSFIRTINSDMNHFAMVDDIADDYFRSSGLSFEGGLSITDLLGFRHWKYLLFRLTGPLGVNSDILNSLFSALESGEAISGKRFGPLLTSSESIIIDRRPELSGLVRQNDENTLKDDICMTVEGPGTYEFNGHRISISVVSATGMDPRQPSGTLVADASALRFPFLLRGWANGDWMTPLGMHGRKKLSDMFVDLKWSLADKRQAVVAVSPELNHDGSGHVAALLCIRIDSRLKLTQATAQAVVIKYI